MKATSIKSYYCSHFLKAELHVAEISKQFTTWASVAGQHDSFMGLQHLRLTEVLE